MVLAIASVFENTVMEVLVRVTALVRRSRILAHIAQIDVARVE